MDRLNMYRYELLNELYYEGLDAQLTELYAYTIPSDENEYDIDYINTLVRTIIMKREERGPLYVARFLYNKYMKDRK